MTTAFIVLAFLVTIPCGAEAVDVEDDGPSDAALKVQSDKLAAHMLASVADKRAGIDVGKAIATAGHKESVHKSRTPKQRALHASKTPLTQDINTSVARERALKAAKIQREERQAKELKDKKREGGEAC